LYSSSNIVRVMKSKRMSWAGNVACMGKRIGVHRVLVGKPEGKRPLGRPWRRWKDNIKMDSYNKSQRDALFSTLFLIIKANEMHYFSTLFSKELYMFRTDLLSIIRSLNIVFTAIGICHTSYVDSLLARSGWNYPDLASR